VTQLNVAGAVERAHAEARAAGTRIDFAPVQPDVLQSSREEYGRLREELDELEPRAETLDAQTTENLAELRSVQRDIVDMEARVEEENAARASVLALREELEALRRRIDALRDEVQTVKTRLLEDLAALDEIPVLPPEARKPLVVRLPDPDAKRASGAEVVDYLVTDGRVYDVRASELLHKFQRELNRAIDREEFGDLSSWREWIHWAVRFGERGRYSNGVIRLRFRAVSRTVEVGGEQRGWDFDIRTELLPSAYGETADGLRGARSSFRRRLAKLNPRKRWLCFQTYEDSFPTYLAAREVAEESGFAVGWIPMALGDELVTPYYSDSGSIRKVPD